MRKVFVSVYDCKPGMQVAEDIYNEYGALIVAENMILDEYIIDRIRNLDLVKIKIYEDTGDKATAGDRELFNAQYNEDVNMVKDILRDISAGKEISVENVNKVTNSIITKINENRDIVDCINELRTVDKYLYTHSINVSLLAMLIGKWLKYDYKKIKSLVISGFLHDVGKSKISQEILNKPGPLSSEEFEEIKKHPTYGYKIAQNIPGLVDDILKGILLHHEREDGSGYPFGLKSEQINDFAKIIAVADIYDAMTSAKTYRSNKCPIDVIETMEKDYFGVLDHKVLSVFLKNIASYYIGDLVKLSNGSIGEIVYINPYNVSKPIVKVDNSYIDLSAQKDIKILEFV